jgi:predicted double-glycine peptidase
VVLERQKKDYDCGVYAVNFLMELHGIYNFGIDFLEQELKTTADNGTTHEDISNWFNNDVLSGYDSDINKIKVPALVNYQYDGEGHYGVVLCITKKMVTIYNPAIGDIEIVDKGQFILSWYSERYGNKWYLSLK